MYNYSIMGLLPGHEEEIAEDILQQYRDGVADLALFKMTMVPEGNPPADKASAFCEQFDSFRDALEAKGGKCGILVQASIGHGWSLYRDFGFQHVVNLTDGETIETVCPYDEDFRAFFKGQMKTLASHRPSLIMVDDDFRLLGREGLGCACPKHMAEFNRRAGTSLTRAELYDILKKNRREDDRLKQIYLDTQRDALVGAARAYREGIDEVDPTLPGAYCCVVGEFAYEIAKELCGKGNPVIVRVNNGNYAPQGARELSHHMLRAAYQIQTVNGPVDAFLAETDTCPQTRYSTCAHSLHAHFTGTILEGASGAKQWITRLSGYEPEAGEGFRKILREYSGFYHTLCDLVPTLKPVGCRIPIPQKWDCRFDKGAFWKVPKGFPVHVLERLGLPMYFSQKSGGAVFMDSDGDSSFSDGELKEMLAGPVFLAGETAHDLCERGLGKYLGVEVKPWENRSHSEILPNGNVCSGQMRPWELAPLSDATRADSMTITIPDGVTRVPLFPGVTVFRNELGGMAVVFSGDPETNFCFQEAFSFVNDSRKAQFVSLLEEAGQLPVYVEGDFETLLRAAELPDGGLFCAVFDLCFDPMDEIALNMERPVTEVTMLGKDGIWRPVAFRTAEGENGRTRVTVETELRTLEPAVLILR